MKLLEGFNFLRAYNLSCREYYPIILVNKDLFRHQEKDGNTTLS